MNFPSLETFKKRPLFMYSLKQWYPTLPVWQPGVGRGWDGSVWVVGMHKSAHSSISASGGHMWAWEPIAMHVHVHPLLTQHGPLVGHDLEVGNPWFKGAPNLQRVGLDDLYGMFKLNNSVILLFRTALIFTWTGIHILHSGRRVSWSCEPSWTKLTRISEWIL